MRPGQDKDPDAPEDDSESVPGAAAPVTKPYEWLVPGAQTWSELGKQVVDSQGAPEPHRDPKMVSGEIGGSGTRLLPDSGIPFGTGVARTAFLSDPSDSFQPGDPAVTPDPLAGGTQLLGGGDALGGFPRTAIFPGSPGAPGAPDLSDPRLTPIVTTTAELGPPGPAAAIPVAVADAPTARAAASADPKWAPGSRIGQYEIIRELGSGGMGVVFLARDDRLGRLVAIKFLQTGNPELTRRFLIEARATAQCSHENIVVIHEVGELQDSPFMVLEYLRGQTLSAVIRKSAPMPPSRAAELIVSVVRALACAHEQGIVHRDLKPENILLTDAGTIKVLDFGIAKVLRDDRAPTAEGERITGARAVVAAGGAPVDLRSPARSGIIGTMAYMSPEQWGSGGEVDARTDIWATGIVLFQMLTGQHPLETMGPNPFPWVANLEVPMPSLHDIAPALPRELADVVDGCLRKRQGDRLPDAPALLRALEPFLPGRFTARPAHQIESGPYAGLRSFQEEDAARFFGRSREIAALVARIQDWPLMATVGPSGVGKSSFVRAGVVPALKSSGEGWEALVVRPGRDPVLALASVLAPLVGSSATVVDDLGAQKELAARLTNEPGYFGSALRSSARRTGQRLLLFVDQFEELYTLGADPAARRVFTACLAAAADDATSPVRVIVSIRSDFLGRVAEDPQFMNDLAKGLLFLGPPSSEGLRDAIVQPAEMAGYRFETPGMIDEMLKHLEATPGALPLLQFTAAQLWETRDPRRKLLTKASYDAVGGIAGALVTHADRVIAKLAPEVQTLARWLFPHLITAERTRAVRDVAELREIAANGSDFDRLVDHLVDSRLLVVQTSSGSGGATTVEIVHESLIGTWPTLQRWLDESHEESVFLDQLWAAARQWQANRRERGLLWGGEMVEELARFRRRYRGELPEIIRAFSESVFEQQARGARRRRRLAIGGGVVLAGLLAAAAVALVVIRNAQKGAEQNAELAQRAEEDAQRRLHEVETKERERQKAEALQRVAEKEVVTANTKVESTNEELAVKNAELTDALARAKEQRGRAEEAQVRAEANERAAREAKDEVQRSATELARLLTRERERADRLKAQLGTLVETLR
jgi:serine/threonine protein kinase